MNNIRIQELSKQVQDLQQCIVRLDVQLAAANARAEEAERRAEVLKSALETMMDQWPEIYPVGVDDWNQHPAYVKAVKALADAEKGAGDES